MPDLSDVGHHPVLEAMVDVLCAKTSNMDRGFFRAEVAYFLGKIASSMRATIVTKDRGEIPVNIYSLALATSGFGKGHSVSIVENEFLAGFKRRFMEDTYPIIAEQTISVLANRAAAKNSTDVQEEIEKITSEWKSKGALLFTFDSGSSPAVKQMREKLLLSGAGAINLQIDEIGSNLIGSTEVLTLFLELYDQGQAKIKLTKVTSDNKRSEELDGKTPANMLLFGTPAKLLDSGQTEEQFYSFLETGYARRCIFGLGVHKPAFKELSPAEIYKRLTQPKNSDTINKWAGHFESLADPTLFNWRMVVEDDVGIELLSYKIDCERRAAAMAEHEEIQKAEISHRYFKALKLAGAYAFIDGSTEVEMDHLKSAMLLVEESGESFQEILNRPKSYVKLARFIADVGVEQTHADILEKLPFYGSSNTKRTEMMNLAIAWGYKNNVIIKKTFNDGIEFFKGETLAKTDIEKIRLSYSNHFAYNYLKETAPFDQLHKLTQAKDLHWCNHHFKNDHRTEENAVPGFNMIVIDVDEGIQLDAVHALMQDYVFMTYTTKRHTPEHNRFRLVLPMNYYLELDSEDYRGFMRSVFSWLPFKTDESSEKREKKWMTFDGGQHHYNLKGELLDVLSFIPKTSRNEGFQNQNKELQSLDNLERWFAQRIGGEGSGRNNHMLRYALTLVDSGWALNDVLKQVVAFNGKLSDPLSENELNSTILVTVAKRFQEAA